MDRPTWVRSHLGVFGSFLQRTCMQCELIAALWIFNWVKLLHSNWKLLTLHPLIKASVAPVLGNRRLKPSRKYLHILITIYKNDGSFEFHIHHNRLHPRYAIQSSPKPIILLAVTIDNVLYNKFNFKTAEYAISLLVQWGCGRFKQGMKVTKLLFQNFNGIQK